MNLIYIHGLDSDANSTKGVLLERYYKKHDPNITVHRPDLNQAPQVVFETLVDMVTTFERDTQTKTVLIGSSLGGYFATQVSNHTGCSALLLNPSTQPHKTLQRFAKDGGLGASEGAAVEQQVIYTTSGGWDMTHADVQWFADHKLTGVVTPNNVVVFIKEGDELLDVKVAAEFYEHHGARVILQAGGDHRFSDFEVQLPQIAEVIATL